MEERLSDCYKIKNLFYEISLYQYCKNIIIDLDKIKCEFNDGDRTIRCNQFDNDFTIGFGPAITTEQLSHRFRLSYCYSLAEAKPIFLFCLEKIFINIFDNDFIFHVHVLDDISIFGTYGSYVEGGGVEYFGTKLVENKMVYLPSDICEEKDVELFLEKLNRTLD